MDNQFVTSCPKCHSKWAHIIDEGTRKICVCTKCVHTEIFYTSSLELEQIHSILVDLKHSNIPGVIISSYETLISLLKDNEIYGALIKIKDIFELVIKLPLVIMLSHISNKVYHNANDKSDFEKNFSSLHTLLQKFVYDAISYQLTLGNWEAISGLIKKHNINDLFPNTEPSSALYTLWNINQKNHKSYTSLKDGTIASWRNKTIGHGALNCNKQDVKKDICEKLSLLNSLLQSTMEDYAQIDILIEDKFINVKAKQESTIIAVEPFIALVDTKTQNNTESQEFLQLDNLSVFESYNEKKQLGHIINYSDGTKYISNNLTTMLTFIDDNLKKFPTLSLIRAKDMGNLDDDTIYSTEIEILNSLNETTFHKGKYFSDWFINCLDSYSSGVFLCCAERGMGKSAFSRAIDQTETIKIKNNKPLSDYLNNNNYELLIRTFHFNSYYNSDIFTFISKIKDIFTTILVSQENNTTYLKSIIYISHNIEESYTALYNSINDVSIPIIQKKNLFLKFLKSLLSLWKYKFQKQKLILVLDGLDEIKEGDNNINISDFLPDNNDLMSNDLDGIYIILTSRCLEEIKSNYKLFNLLTSYKFTDKLILKRELNQTIFNSPYSKAFISEIKNTFNTTDDIQAISIANNLEWRYNYLTAYKKLYSVDSSKNLQCFMDDPFEVYLNQLSALSRSYAEDIKSMLNLLTITNEALTISEISYLITGDNKPTFKLYGMLMDIINFLNVERGYERGTLFNISHPDWIAKINKNKTLSTNRKLLTDRLTKQLLEMCSNKLPSNDFSSSIYDGEAWLISNAHLFGVSMYDSLDQVSNIDFGQYLYQIHRSIRLNKQLVASVKEADIATLDKSSIKKYINSYLSLAEHYSKLNDFYKCLSYCDVAINICNKLSEFNNHEEFFVSKSLSDVYHKKAKILKFFTEFDESIKYYLKSIKLKEKLTEEYKNGGYFYDLDSLAASYHDLAKLLNESNPKEAQNLHCKAIVIREQLAEDYKNGGRFFDLDLLATSYNSLAILLKKSNLKEAQTLLFKAIVIREQLAEDYKNGGRFFDLDLLAISYNNLAVLLKDSNPKKALNLYNKAIVIREQLAKDYKNGGRFFDLDLLAISYHNFAIFLADSNPKKALNLYDKAIVIKEQLAEDYKNGGRFFNLNSLISSYQEFGIFLKEIDSTHASKLFSKNIIIGEQLAEDYKNGGRFFDLDLLAISYSNLAILLKESNPKVAQNLFWKAISTREQLAEDYKNGGHFFDLNKLATSYNNFAKFLRNVDFSRAIEFFSKGIAIREQLAEEYKNGGRFFDLNSLSTSYSYLAILLKESNLEESRNLYGKAIAIDKQLAEDYKNGGRFFDLDSLATSYNNLAMLLEKSNLEESQNLYGKAIEIKEQLAEDYKNGGRFFDLDSLATSYNNLAMLLYESNPEKARNLHIKGIAIEKQLAEDYKNGGRFFDLDSLATSYNNLATLLYESNPEEARNLYDKAIATREQLAEDYKNGGRFFNLFSLAISYHNLARLLENSNSEEARNLYDKAIAIGKQLAEEYKNGGRFFNLDNLARIYVSTAKFLKKIDTEKTKKLINTAIEIREQLAEDYKNGGRFFDLNSLTETYEQRNILLNIAKHKNY